MRLIPWSRKSDIADLRIGCYLIPMTTISLKIPEELASKLDATARAKHVSRSALFREALEEKLEAIAGAAKPSLLDQSGDLCGSGASGIGDLASNPKHIEGFGS